MYVSVHAMHFLNFYVLVCKHDLFKHGEEKQHLWYVESRQKLNSGLGGFLVCFFLGGCYLGFFFLGSAQAGIQNLSQLQAMAGLSTTTLRCLANPFEHEIQFVSKLKQTFKNLKKTPVFVCTHILNDCYLLHRKLAWKPRILFVYYMAMGEHLA